LEKLSKDYEIGREREYEIIEKLKKTRKVLDWSTGQWTNYDQK